MNKRTELYEGMELYYDNKLYGIIEEITPNLCNVRLESDRNIVQPFLPESIYKKFNKKSK